MEVDTPDTVVMSAMTAVTPIIIPKMVRNDRRRFCVMFATDMRLLMVNQNAILPKETLLMKVWGYDTDAGDNNVEAYISFLRKKLALLQSTVTLNVVRRLGYRLEESKAWR